MKLGIPLATFLCSVVSAQGVKTDPVPPAAIEPLGPEAERATMRVPPGFRVELVAAEPLVVEPACCAFDGDGNLWVAELRTYMQDIDGKGTDEARSVVARLRDTDRDGRMDERVEFATGLVLPRLLLPLDAHHVLIQQTYDGVLWCYVDEDGDGRSDRREEWYRYPRSGANLEHQDSALIWGIDNWLYTAMGGKRHRATLAGISASEDVPSEFAQWGLAVDDLGRQFFSSAGGERPAYGFQQHPIYGKFEVEHSLAPGFEVPFPILAIPDVQGGPGRLSEKGTLNHFTGCCGQTIYRGDRLPAEMRGDWFIAEPVGRLIRRARIDVVGAQRVLRNAYDQAEFVASTDPCFRPIWLTTAPDGCLWVVDMYRGIIQEGNWVREGSYLRGVVQKLGLDANVGRGRIWRIVHESAKPGPMPHMSSETPAQLVAHLGDANGLWRDLAQRALVLAGDRSVVPALRKLAIDVAAPPLARVHALWTLDGLDSTEARVLRVASRDPDPRVRATAIRVAESLFRKGDLVLYDDLAKLAKDPSLDVVVQLVQSLRFVPIDAARELVLDLLVAHSGDATFRAIGNTTLRGTTENDGTAIADLSAEDLVRVHAGRDVYRSLCIACHGPDGAGVQSGDLMLAPPLRGSRRLCGSVDGAARILLFGMTGPIAGHEYPGNLMAPMGQNDDEWIAAVLSYARNSFGNAAAPIAASSIARVRAACAGRNTPFTVAEIDAFQPVDRSVMKSWKLSASDKPEDCGLAIDGDRGSRYTTGTPMHDGMWFQIDFGSPWTIDGLVLDARGSNGDYPRGFEIRLSDDGADFTAPVALGQGAGPVTAIDIATPRPARFLRIVQTGKTDGLWWSIHELEVHGRPAR
ncbi:MAG: discoidin domain-containing protein [Planctomycetota bacterium]